jgi:glycosyltransferase 2 family protein
MSGTLWRWVRPLSGAAILAVLLASVGTAPFVTAYRVTDGWSLAGAVGITLLTTVCCAARWSVVTRSLGVGVPLREAVPAYYRSQFLNTVLPGGVLGDVHRAVRHGREGGAVGRSVLAVACERTAGQGVQLLLTGAALLVLPSPWRSDMPVLVAALVAAALVVVLGARALPGVGGSLRARTRQVASADLRLLARPAWTVIVLASAVAVAGHVALFLIAARTAGSTASTVRLLPLALLVLLAAGVPTNLAGWGPREGAAAWVFSSAGLSAAQGLATAVLYGVLVFAASLPGAVVLVVAAGPRGAARRRGAAEHPLPSASASASASSAPATAGLEAAPRG